MNQSTEEVPWGAACGCERQGVFVQGSGRAGSGQRPRPPLGGSAHCTPYVTKQPQAQHVEQHYIIPKNSIGRRINGLVSREDVSVVHRGDHTKSCHSRSRDPTFFCPSLQVLPGKELIVAVPGSPLGPAKVCLICYLVSFRMSFSHCGRGRSALLLVQANPAGSLSERIIG